MTMLVRFAWSGHASRCWAGRMARPVLDQTGVVEQDAALRPAAGQAFYNTSQFTLRDLRARASRQQLRADFEAYLDGFSPNVQDILENFEFRNQIPRLSKADALGTLIEKLTSPDINLSPAPVKHADGSVRYPGLDNHGMGSIFEELVRRFNEENNEEAGEHWTPRDAVRLMAKLAFLSVVDDLKSGTYLLYDGACGTGGMLTVAEETLRQLAAEHGKDVSTHLFGQEINAETYAICTADLLLKGEGEAADNIVGGQEHSTLANDAFPSREFDFMLSNPPYGKSWKTDLERMGGKKDMRDSRFVIEHAGDPEYSLVTRSSDGQMLFAYRVANYVNYISSYEDPGSTTTAPVIDPFLTWDTSFLWRFPGSGIDLTLYAVNLTGRIPPWANIEQSYDGLRGSPSSSVSSIASRTRARAWAFCRQFSTSAPRTRCKRWRATFLTSSRSAEVRSGPGLVRRSKTVNSSSVNRSRTCRCSSSDRDRLRASRSWKSSSIFRLPALYDSDQCLELGQKISAGRVGANQRVELRPNSGPKLLELDVLARRRRESLRQRLEVNQREVDRFVPPLFAGAFSGDPEPVSRNRAVEEGVDVCHDRGDVRWPLVDALTNGAGQ